VNDASSEALLLPRRTLLAAGALWAGLPALLVGCGREQLLDNVASPDFLTTVAEIVIPATKTPGARGVLAGDFIGRAFAHGLFGGDEGTGAAIERVLNARVPSGDFMHDTLRHQIAAVTRLDAETFARPAPVIAPAAQYVGRAPAGSIAAPPEPEPNRLWRMMKNAIVVAYYMSEAGASQELRYELVPGHFDPDIPFRPGDTYLSNNWIANLG
jgi:hypothetical protein